ncbi:hypothetical protein FRC06_008412, partial [Ceratobasidium sp. 370]
MPVSLSYNTPYHRSYVGGYRVSNTELTKIASRVEGLFQSDVDATLFNAFYWLRRTVPEFGKFTFESVDEDEDDCYFILITQAGDNPQAIVQTSKDLAIKDEAVRLGMPLRG